MTNLTEQEINERIAKYMGYFYWQKDKKWEGFWVNSKYLKPGNSDEYYQDELLQNRYPFKLSRELNYTESLDACVPVVEKISINVWTMVRNLDSGGFDCIIEQSVRSSKKSSPSLALSTALYHAIGETESE